jgi:hypothetical protein
MRQDINLQAKHKNIRYIVIQSDAHCGTGHDYLSHDVNNAVTYLISFIHVTSIGISKARGRSVSN